MRPQHELNIVQRWMQAVITNPDGILDGIESSEAQQAIAISSGSIESVILPSKRCSSVERMSVYGNAYFARLIECLAGEFPSLKHAIGEELFTNFAISYLQNYPSQSYTLNNLSNHFVDFLVDARPPRELDSEPEWPDFLIELARLETIYSDVFDGPGEEHLELLSADQIQQIPAEQWGEIRIQFVDSFRLEYFEFPVHEYVTAVRREESPEPPAPQPTWLAVSRRDFIVRRQPLLPIQFELLKQLREGFPLAEAIERSLMETDAEIDVLAASLSNWFANWTASGWFRSIQTEG